MSKKTSFNISGVSDDTHETSVDLRVTNVSPVITLAVTLVFVGAIGLLAVAFVTEGRGSIWNAYTYAFLVSMIAGIVLVFGYLYVLLENMREQGNTIRQDD